jgi:hypothetical protein
VFFFADSLKKAMKKGVQIQVITEMPEDGDPLPMVIEEYVSPGTSLDLRYASKLSNHYLISDNTEVLICTSAEADFAECPCLWTNSSSLLALTQENFKNALHTSMNWTKTASKTVSRRVVVPHLRSQSMC